MEAHLLYQYLLYCLLVEKFLWCPNFNPLYQTCMVYIGLWDWTVLIASHYLYSRVQSTSIHG